MDLASHILSTIKYYLTNFLIITSSTKAMEFMHESMGKVLWMWNTKAINTGALSPRYSIAFVLCEGMYHLLITTQSQDDAQWRQDELEDMLSRYEF